MLIDLSSGKGQYYIKAKIQEFLVRKGEPKMKLLLVLCADLKEVDPAVLNYAATKIQAGFRQEQGSCDPYIENALKIGRKTMQKRKKTKVRK